MGAVSVRWGRDVFVVDTNVVSETTRPRPSPSVIGFLAAQPVVVLSVVSLMELQAGVLLAPPVRRDRLARWLEALLTSGSVLLVPVDEPVARAAAHLRATHRARRISTEDLFIGATALVRGEVLVTRNTRDFEVFGVPLLDPFTP